MAEFQISSKRSFDVFNVVGMLVNSNDAFLTIDSERLPKTRRTSVVYQTLAYDAGSEANNEDCAFIPGPACPADSGNARALDDAEGYIYVHNGIHDSADLSSAAYDWRNPIAIIKGERIRNPIQERLEIRYVSRAGL